MEKSLELVRQLVSDFREHEKAYLAPSYQEQHVREDFINKFFTALGWDVSHQRQKNPYEQEVKIENKVSTQGSQRRADYAFFIAPNFRDVKFYAEAKKPARNLKDAAFYHQTIRYGWNSGTPIAILTDFEEFHILDCRYKPDIDNALNRKLEYFHYSEYADEEKFKKIFCLFSREAVAGGSLEKYVAALPKPRGGGKAKQRGLFKGAYQPVDEAFLEELDSYRATLAKAFKKENNDLGSEELTEAIQRTIDRLVFIRFLEDKQIEDPQMMNYIGSGSAWKKFSAHCHSLEPKYNGLVFKKHRILDDTGFVPPDDQTFAGICDELVDPSSPYDFDKIPISILGSIYERFLGKVVHATAKQVKVEPKPEVRKAGGVYYTPQYIVRYIVSETVGKLLYETLTPVPSPKLGEGCSDSSEQGEGKRFRLTPKQVEDLKIIDIACGSGSFLIEVFNVLLEYHERYYAAHPEVAKKGDLSTRDGKKVLSLKKRQEILLNNIYGVDIDFQATEVTQLSLYLKLLEEATLNDAVQFSLLKEKLLPDLKNNIVCGNSLIGTDINTGELFENKELHNLKPMNFEDAFPEIFSPLERGQRGVSEGGFDAVVGNPPYVGRSTSFEELEKKYIKANYVTSEGKYELYQLFIEKSTKITKSKEAFVSLITPQTWLSIIQATKLRKYILSNYDFDEIVFLGKDVFNASVDIIIFVLKTGFATNKIRFIEGKSLLENKIISSDKIIDVGSISNKDFIIPITEDKISSDIISRIHKDTVPLDSIGNWSDGIKVVGKAKEFAFQSKKIDRSFFPMYSGSDIERYKLSWSGLYCCRDKENIIKHKATDIRLRDEEVFNRIKIIIRKTGNNIIASIDENKYYYEQSLFSYSTNDNSIDLKFIVAVLNSKIGDYILRQNPFSKKDTFPQIRLHWLKEFPIKIISKNSKIEKSLYDEIVKLVDQMMGAKEELASAKLDSDVQRLERHCATLDRQIDEAVYELYGLTEEEIKIVEGV